MVARNLTLALLAGTALSFAGAAYAADVYVPPAEPAMAAPAPTAWSWTGIYFGANGGYAWATATDESYYNDTSPAGWLAGGQIGANWQMGSIVLGIEGSYDVANLKDSLYYTGGPTYLVDQSINSVAAIRARLGFAMDRFLVYGTGGWAWADTTRRFTFFGVNEDSEVLNGWTAGAGIEVALTDHVTAKLQYDYYDFGSTTYALLANTTVSTTMSTVTAGFNIKF